MKIEIIILSRFGTMFGRHIKIQQLYFFMKMGPIVRARKSNRCLLVGYSV